jgi:hypothetical protein
MGQVDRDQYGEYAHALDAAGLLAAPVGCDLRGALARELADTWTDAADLSDPDGNDSFLEHDTQPWVDRLLPIIAAYVTEEVRAAKEEAFTEGRFSVQLNPYRKDS